MTTTRLADDDLRRSSNHLHYEYWMLVSIANSLTTIPAEKGWLQNALLESFVIHYRTLFDFFYSQPRNDDVSASHYFADPDEWHQLRPAETELLRSCRRRAAKEIAHLTYSRLNVTAQSKPWRFLEIARDLNGVMAAFLNSVPKVHLGDDWTRTLQEPIPLLGLSKLSMTVTDVSSSY